MYEGCQELATQLKEQAIHSEVCYGQLSSVVDIFTFSMWTSNSKKFRVIYSFIERGIHGDVLLWCTSL